MGVKLRLCLVAVFGFMIVVSAAIFVVAAVLVLRILEILRVLRIFVLIVVFVFHDFFPFFFKFFSIYIFNMPDFPGSEILSCRFSCILKLTI